MLGHGIPPIGGNLAAEEDMKKKQLRILGHLWKRQSVVEARANILHSINEIHASNAYRWHFFGLHHRRRECGKHA